MNHEKHCFKNPALKACASCWHNKIDYETIYDPNHGGNPGSSDYDVACNYCDKLDIVLDNKTLKMNCNLHSTK